MMRFLLPTFVAMKTDFLYSTDFFEMNGPELNHTCMHLLCTASEGSFVFNEHCYHIMKNDLVVIPMPDRIKNLAAHPDMLVEWFAADYKFLQNLLPSNNYSIGGSISLNRDPVISLNDEQARRMLEDFHRLRDRMGDRDLQFYHQLMGSLCLTMMYDIFEAHAQREATDTHTDRTAYIVKQLMALLATGVCLSATVKRVTGHSVTSYIDRHAIPILKDYLDDDRLSLTQIAERMNFTSLSYFSRYCSKHLGHSPSEYRRSLQPKR